jgi:E3 ubiquitin-protein ligase MYCBP2
VADEEVCFGCWKNCGEEGVDGEDYCTACYTESLAEAPSLKLACGHVFHYDCMRRKLSVGWDGPAIRFGFLGCPLCRAEIYHPTLVDLLAPILTLREKVKEMALMRLKFEGKEGDAMIKDAGSKYHDDPAGFAMDQYNYYQCHKCKDPYFGGARVCGAAAAVEFNPEDLTCPKCLPLSAGVTDCPKHGKDYIEYKCRFCCSIAIFFCFGTTHFCDACHREPGRMTGMGKDALPKCPAGPLGKQLDGECPLGVDHPEGGEEFALGCGLCRNEKSF